MQIKLIEDKGRYCSREQCLNDKELNAETPSHSLLVRLRFGHTTTFGFKVLGVLNKNLLIILKYLFKLTSEFYFPSDLDQWRIYYIFRESDLWSKFCVIS